MSSPLREAVESSSVLITVGSGGVGKTTVAATLALRAAMDAKSALVCTIDPAKRLAQALGLSALGNAETRISDDVFAQAGVAVGAPLYAMMLDMKRTWDELIERHVTPETRERIFANRFYQSLSTVLAGSQEYVAMEKLWELRTKRAYPLIVLDTPPTTHALDFLEAPSRVLEFLDNDAAKWLASPALAAGKLGLKLFGGGGGYVAKMLARFTGTETLQQLADFMLSISGMNSTFRERAEQTRALLEADSTAFVLVTGAMPERLDEIVYFHRLLTQNKLRTAAVVVNRVHVRPPMDALKQVETLPEELRRKMEETIEEMTTMAERDERGIAALREQCGVTPLVLLPRLDADIHDLAGLWEISRWLFDDAHLEVRPSAD
jgi:anion-transporting  ArsA/GET3 family ATPase